MYQRSAAAAAGCTGGGLVWSGWNVTWTVVAGLSLLIACGVILRLVPRRRGAR